MPFGWYMSKTSMLWQIRSPSLTEWNKWNEKWSKQRPALFFIPVLVYPTQHPAIRNLWTPKSKAIVGLLYLTSVELPIPWIFLTLPLHFLLSWCTLGLPFPWYCLVLALWGIRNNHSLFTCSPICQVAVVIFFVTLRILPSIFEVFYIKGTYRYLEIFWKCNMCNNVYMWIF